MLIYFLLTFLYNTQVTTFTAEWMYACLIRTEKIHYQQFKRRFQSWGHKLSVLDDL